MAYSSTFSFDSVLVLVHCGESPIVYFELLLYYECLCIFVVMRRSSSVRNISRQMTGRMVKMDRIGDGLVTLRLELALVAMFLTVRGGCGLVSTAVPRHCEWRKY